MRLHWLLLWVLLAGSVAASPAGTTRGAGWTTYDAARVDRHVRALAETIGPRSAGSAAERQAASYIADELKSIGLSTEIQPFQVIGGSGSYWSANVVATKPGVNARYGTIYIGAHYDSVPGSPGANDNASGTAVLLELARLLANRELKPRLVLIAFGAEEVGLRGSSAFVRQLAPLERETSLGMLNLDCVGYGTHQMVATSFGTDTALVDRVVAVATRLGLEIERGPYLGNSDHAPFANAGIPAAFVATRDAGKLCGPNYHQPTDTSNTLDAVQMEHVGRIVLAAAEDLSASATLLTPTQVRLPLLQAGAQPDVFGTAAKAQSP